MSRKGNCWDNAVTETLFGSLKVERLHGERFRNHSPGQGRGACVAAVVQPATHALNPELPQPSGVRKPLGERNVHWAPHENVATEADGGNAGRWKAWKTIKPFPTLPTDLGNRSNRFPLLEWPAASPPQTDHFGWHEEARHGYFHSRHRLEQDHLPRNRIQHARRDCITPQVFSKAATPVHGEPATVADWHGGLRKHTLPWSCSANSGA